MSLIFNARESLEFEVLKLFHWNDGCHATNQESWLKSFLSVFHLLIKLINYGYLAVAAMSDDPVRKWILTEGNATEIIRISPIGGGCINRASRYDTDAGSFFVKTNRFGCMVLLMLKVVFFDI